MENAVFDADQEKTIGRCLYSRCRAGWGVVHFCPQETSTLVSCPQEGNKEDRMCRGAHIEHVIEFLDSDLLTRLIGFWVSYFIAQPSSSLHPCYGGPSHHQGFWRTRKMENKRKTLPLGNWENSPVSGVKGFFFMYEKCSFWTQNL